MIHYLRTWPNAFKSVKDGEKTAEFRKNDRDFKPGDVLGLLEYDVEKEQTTGKLLEVAVTHIVYGPAFGIPDGYCMMSIREIEK